MATPTLSYRYDNSPAVSIRAQRELGRRSRLLKFVQFGYVVMPLLSIGISLLAGDALSEAIRKNLFWIIGLPLIGFVGVPLINKWQMTRRFRANPALGGDQEVKFTEDGILMSSASATSMLRWPILIRIVEGREFFLFYVLPGRAHCLPIASIPPAELPAVRAFIASHATSPTELAA
jgi:hypothetical protein